MLKRARRIFGPSHLEFGPEYEKEGSDGFLGLNVGIEVPIFDNGKLKLEKAKAELSLAKHQLLVMKILLPLNYEQHMPTYQQSKKPRSLIETS